MKYPFSPDILDAMPEELAELYRELEIYLLQEIAERLIISDQLNEVTVQQIRALRSHGITQKEINKAIQKTARISEEKLNALLDDVVETNQQYYTELIDLAKVTKPETLVNASEIAAIRRQTWSAFRNISGSMGFLVSKSGRLEFLPPAKAFEHCLDMAIMKVQSGAESYSQAIAQATRELADGGLKAVYYEPKADGGKPHYDQVDVSVRRAVMTGVSQLNQQYAIQSMDYLGTDYVEVSAHAGARDIDGPKGWEAHTKWQGKVFKWKKQGLHPHKNMI